VSGFIDLLMFFYSLPSSFITIRFSCLHWNLFLYSTRSPHFISAAADAASAAVAVIAVETKSVVRGQSTSLTCPLDISNCGELHSIKWFKGSDRIGVASGDGKYSQVEGSFQDR